VLNFFFKNTFLVYELLYLNCLNIKFKNRYKNIFKLVFKKKYNNFSNFCFLKNINSLKKKRLFLIKNKQFLFKSNLRLKLNKRYNKNRIKSLFYKPVLKKKGKPMGVNFYYSYLNSKYFWDLTLAKQRNKLNIVVSKKKFNKKFFFRKTNPHFFFSSFVFFKLLNLIFYLKLISKFDDISFGRACGFLNIKINNEHVSNKHYSIKLYDHVTFSLSNKNLKNWIKRIFMHHNKLMNFFLNNVSKRKKKRLGFFFKKKKIKFRNKRVYTWFRKFEKNTKSILPISYLLNYELNFLNLSVFQIQKLNYSFYNWYIYNIVRIFNWRSYTWQLRKHKLFKSC